MYENYCYFGFIFLTLFAILLYKNLITNFLTYFLRFLGTFGPSRL